MKLGQTLLSPMNAGPATIVVPFMLSRLAIAPAPGISKAQAPVIGGFCGLPFAKFSLMDKKPVSAIVNVPLMNAAKPGEPIAVDVLIWFAAWSNAVVLWLSPTA